MVNFPINISSFFSLLLCCCRSFFLLSVYIIWKKRKKNAQYIYFTIYGENIFRAMFNNCCCWDAFKLNYTTLFPSIFGKTKNWVGNRNKLLNKNEDESLLNNIFFPNSISVFNLAGSNWWTLLMLRNGLAENEMHFTCCILSMCNCFQLIKWMNDFWHFAVLIINCLKNID